MIAKTRIREFLAELNRTRGVTILLTTHDLADIERLCNRIIVIDHGRIIHDGDLARLRAEFSTNRTLTVDFDETPQLRRESEAFDLIEQEGPRVKVTFDRTRFSAPAILEQLGAFGTIRDMSIEEPDIEEVIRHVYGRGARSQS
jgi:ABC-2 type transport system ATP-binding protein